MQLTASQEKKKAAGKHCLVCVQSVVFIFPKDNLIRRPGSACTVFLSYVEYKICPQSKNQKSKIQNPKSKIRNPKSKIQNLGALGASHKELLHNDPKSKIHKIRSKKYFGLGNFGFWGGPGDVPLGNSVTVP